MPELVDQQTELVNTALPAVTAAVYATTARLLLVLTNSYHRVPTNRTNALDCQSIGPLSPPEAAVKCPPSTSQIGQAYSPIALVDTSIVVESDDAGLLPNVKIGPLVAKPVVDHRGPASVLIENTHWLVSRVPARQLTVCPVPIAVQSWLGYGEIRRPQFVET